MIQWHVVDDNAVSPVIGVMLMLVVTIIIAAVVSAFSGSVAQDETIAPQVTLSASYVSSIIDTDKTNTEPDHPASFKPNNGIEFRLSGGDFLGYYRPVEEQGQCHKLRYEHASPLWLGRYIEVDASEFRGVSIFCVCGEGTITVGDSLGSSPMTRQHTQCKEKCCEGNSHLA